MAKSRDGVLKSFASVVGPAVPVLVGVVLTILLTISPRDASRNFTAWGEAFSDVLASLSGRAARAPSGAVHAAAAAAWFNPGVIVVLIGIAVSLATGFATGWLQLRETRKRAVAVVADAIHGDLLAKLTSTHPGPGGQGD
jgi:hypothetical protein